MMVAVLKQMTTPLTPYNFGAVGDGVADDTMAVQAAIDDAPVGGTVYIPPGLFKVSANGSELHNRALAIRKSLRLELDPLAKLVMAPNNFDEYAVIDIGTDPAPSDPAPVEVVGGQIIGDLSTHIANEGIYTGERGFGIFVWARDVTVRDVIVAECWGDGIFVGPKNPSTGGFAAGVSIINCTCDDNRRNGMSIVDVEGCRVIGGSFQRSGQTAETLMGRELPDGPYTGIYAQPSDEHKVVGVTIDGVTCAGNVGSAVLAMDSTAEVDGGVCEVLATGCTSNDDGELPFVTQYVGSFGGQVGTFVGCVSTGAGGSGFVAAASPTNAVHNTPRWIGCQAIGAANHGFIVSGDPPNLPVTGVEIVGCTAMANGYNGFVTGPWTTGVHLSQCSSVNNGTDPSMDPGPYESFNIYGSFHVLQSCFATAAGAKIAYNYALQAEQGDPPVGGVGHQLRDCLVGAAGTVGQYFDGSTDSSAFPTPGAALPPPGYGISHGTARTLGMSPNTEQVADVLSAVVADLIALGLFQVE